MPHEGIALYPDWSPDGTRIAFTEFADDGRFVATVSVDGTGQPRLTAAGDDYLHLIRRNRSLLVQSGTT